MNLLESLVVIANFLHPYVIVWVEESFWGGIAVCDGDDTGDVLEVLMVLNFYLSVKKCHKARDLILVSINLRNWFHMITLILNTNS